MARHFTGTALEELKTPDLRAYFKDLALTHAAKTVRESQLGVRRFFRFLEAEGEIEFDPMTGMKLMNFRVAPQPAYTQPEVRRLVLACDNSKKEGIRDAALLTVLFDTGVREGELVSMTVPDFEKPRLLVFGKTGWRAVPIGAASLRAIDRYVRRWRLREGEPLWWGAKGPLTESGVFQAVRRLCRRAGVTHKGIHGFRRAAAAQMKRLGMNDSDILEVMGWRDVTMLRRYTSEVAEELAFSAHRRHSPGDSLHGPSRANRDSQVSL